MQNTGSLSPMNDPKIFRVLLLADTHIGLDFPLKPRIERRRRGHDFMANFRLALQPALTHQVDAVVHGGDLFDRSRIPDALVQMALEPLVEVAEAGVPVFLVPGNHERGKIPLQLWRSHANLHVFDRPGSVVLVKNDLRVCFSGFPFTRKIQDQFSKIVSQTELQHTPADIRLLCMHQTVEGAKVGPVDFSFRSGPDIIRGADMPTGFAAVLSGHIHRCQALRKDLSGNDFAAPVIYPGSVERTAFAEQKERKGCLILDFQPDSSSGGRLTKIHFRPLPARPMVSLEFDMETMPAPLLRENLRIQLAALDPDSVVRIRPLGEITADAWQVLSAASLRSLAPSTMNIELSGLSFKSEEKKFK